MCDLHTRCDMHMFAATVCVLSRRHFAPSCVCMYAVTVRMLSRQRFAPPGINYLRTMNAMTLMAFKFLLHDFVEKMLFKKICTIWSGKIWKCDLYLNKYGNITRSGKTKDLLISNEKCMSSFKALLNCGLHKPLQEHTMGLEKTHPQWGSNEQWTLWSYQLK